MCFSSIFSWKLRIIPYIWEIDVRTPTSFWSSDKFIKFEPGVKLVSTVAEWIVLSFDTPYYTELPPYSPKTEIEKWIICHIYSTTMHVYSKL